MLKICLGIISNSDNASGAKIKPATIVNVAELTKAMVC